MDDKVRENRLRRMADRQGLVLRKSRRRDPRARDYRKFWLLRDDLETVAGGEWGVTLDEVERWILDNCHDERDSAEWQQFERLVGRIQRALSPADAVITLDDHILDRFTGELRQVDASIRYRLGGIPILITVECRDWSAEQDSTWIEQLATKRADIGAHLTVAVSSSGFYSPAFQKAAQHGILLRKIDEITEEDVRSWFLASELNYSQSTYQIDHINLWFYDDEPVIELSDESDPVQSGEHNLDVPILFLTPNHRPIIAAEAVRLWEANGGVMLPIGMEIRDELKRAIELRFAMGDAYTSTDTGWKWVQRVKVYLRIVVRHTPIPVSRIIQTSNVIDDRTLERLAQTLEFELPDGGVISIHRSDETGEIAMSLHGRNAEE